MSAWAIAGIIYLCIGIYISLGALWNAAMYGDIRNECETQARAHKHPKVRAGLIYTGLVLITILVWPVPVAMLVYEWIQER